MNKLDYLNVGCGMKFHRAWHNVDMVSKDPDVQAANLIQGIPFEDNRFDVVYHSQVLEHIPRGEALKFIAECRRVLRPGGVLRVVVPDLENIAREYLRLLDVNATAPTQTSEADYDWIMLEFFDQVVRHRTGGDMAAYLTQAAIPNEDYVVDRIGKVGRDLLHARGQAGRVAASNAGLLTRLRRATPGKVWRRLSEVAVQKFGSDALKVGRFRLGGEVHMWMYDRHSLSRLLIAAGFNDVTLQSPHTSAVPEWSTYGLDVRDGHVVDPTSLFMEARK